MNYRGFVLVALLVSLTGLQGNARQRSTATAVDRVATVGSLTISRAELDRLADGKLLRVRADEFNIKQHVLEDRIADLLLQLESSRTGQSADAILRTEVDGKARPVTLEEAKAVFESARERFTGSTEEAALASIRDVMLKQRVSQRRLAFMKELRARYGVETFLSPPRVTLAALNGPSRGPTDAPVTIVEFSDFQCPYCAAMTTTLETVMRKYGTQVRRVYKHYPLTIHADAARAGEAAACADEQGKFWAMHDIIFANPRNLSAASLNKYARDAELDAARFEDCLKSGRGAEVVSRDRAEGDKYGVSNTPTFFVNGRFLLGSVPPDVLATVLDEELARVK